MDKPRHYNTRGNSYHPNNNRSFNITNKSIQNHPNHPDDQSSVDEQNPNIPIKKRIQSDSALSHYRSHSPKLGSRLNGYISTALGRNSTGGKPNGYTNHHAGLSTCASTSLLDRGKTVVSDDMCHYCFDVLKSYLDDKQIPPPPDSIPNDSYPLFVTWKSGRNPRLRGCIGTFSSLNLHRGLRDYAISSAVQDSRFTPISKDELPKLSVSVSILHEFEHANDHYDWEIGIHGIRIEYTSEKGSKKTATYLPEVASEQGWDHLQTIDSLLRKAGYKGGITHELRSNLRITRYRSSKTTVGYSQYLTFKKVI